VAKKKRARVVVTVDGGIVQDVATDTRDIDVYVFDYDDIRDMHGDPMLTDEPGRYVRDAERGTKAVDKQLERWRAEAQKELVFRNGEKAARR